MGTKTDWTIRKAIIDDAKALKNCMELAYYVYQDRLDGERLPPMDVDYEEEISSFPAWVVESDKKIIGGLILMFEDEYATVANIAVHPDFQGSGLGQKLMDFAESEAKSRGYSEIRLATHVLLSENVSFYLHLGWSEMSRDENRIYMRKSLKIS